MTEDIRDDIRKTRDPRDGPDAEFSTADLAGSSQAMPRTIDVKPLLDRESPQPLDGPS